eukprot:364166-Chlamydomonas_euryale.AAC.3
MQTSAPCPSLHPAMPPARPPRPVQPHHAVAIQAQQRRVMPMHILLRNATTQCQAPPWLQGMLMHCPALTKLPHCPALTKLPALPRTD